jgi:hypothetical protein
MSEFFEYKFLSMENYYNYICKEKLTYVQSGGRCFIDFTLVLSEKNIKSLAIYSTILAQISKYVDALENFKEEYYEICALLPLNELLTENEKDYLNDDIDFIKYKIKG